jgi:hypothetical protein
MKLSVILFVTIFLLSSAKTFAGVAVLCEGMTYSNVMNYVSNLNMKDLQAVVISSPFKAFDRTPAALDGPVFDFNDTGNKFQRGAYQTLLGDEAGLRALADFLYRRNVGLYAKTDLFRQKKGYNRGIWNNADFIPENQIYGGDLIVDIRNSDTRGKLSYAIGAMKRLPVQKWVIDVRTLPADRRSEYVEYIAGNFGSSSIILSDSEQNRPEVAHIRDYYNLRTNAFSVLQPNLKVLERYSADGGFIHSIENDAPLVNNTGPLMMLLLQRCNVLLSKRMLNPYHQALIGFIADFGGYEKRALTNDKFIVFNQDKMIAVNYTDSFAVWNVKNPVGRKGFYKAIASGALLKLGDKNMTVFLFPKSIAFWDLRK